MRKIQYRKLKECLRGKNSRGKDYEIHFYGTARIKKRGRPIRVRRRPLNAFTEFPIDADICSTAERGDEQFWINSRRMDIVSYRRSRQMKICASPSTSFDRIEVCDFIQDNEWKRTLKFIRRGE